MSELLDRLSSYNLFNYLLPGAVFTEIGEEFTSYTLAETNIVAILFVYYFVGLVISRIGSLVLEPALKWARFVTFAPYPDFVAASRKDTKIELLSEANNMYRTLAAMVAALVALVLYERACDASAFVDRAGTYFVLAGLFLLFLFSYRKQTNYITARVETAKEAS